MTPTFDEQVAAYDRWYTTPLGQLVDRVEKAALFEFLPELQGRRVLEVGCGTGNISLALAGRGARLVGLDVSGPMLAAAHHKARRQGLTIPWLRGRAAFLPFPDAVFDGVISILSLDFIDDREAAVGEMIRVLRPGGFLVVAMLNRYSLWTLKRLLRAWFKPSFWRGVHFITPRELRRLLADQPDLGEIRCGQAVYFPPWDGPGLAPYYPHLERLGQKLHLPTGAFLVAAARRAKGS
ncbi:MAG: class I SAM-dependent methyltransferase [Thermodesulfobacteriota bacterium]